MLSAVINRQQIVDTLKQHIRSRKKEQNMQKMPVSTKEQLVLLEKLAKRIKRRSLKDNTLEHTVQATMSSLEPGVVKYAAHISSPSAGVQPITWIHDNFNVLVGILEEAEKEINTTKVELAFHESRINTYKAKIAQHEKRVEVLKSPDYDPEEDRIAMEEVGTDNG